MPRKMFSGKKKKEQLQNKRQRQQDQAGAVDPYVKRLQAPKVQTQAQAEAMAANPRTRYALMLNKDTREDIEQRKQLARQPLERLSPVCMSGKERNRGN